MNQIEYNDDTVFVIHGKHTGRSGIVSMIYYDHKHTGESDDLLCIRADDGCFWVLSSEVRMEKGDDGG